MKNSFKICTLILMIVVLISHCSEDKSPLPSISHADGWNSVQSADFHGEKVLTSGYETCKSCHGVDFKGGKSGVSCYDCHATFPHPDEWGLIGYTYSHGAYIKAHNGTIESCRKCHGTNLNGGSSGVSCYDCHAEGSFK